MRKIFLILLFCLLTATCSAQDYWVYIRTYDKPELRIGDGGRSKKGDIIAVREDNLQNIPTEEEKKEWLIIKVKNLTTKDLDLLLDAWTEKESIIDMETGTIFEREKTIAYRRNKFNLDGLNLPQKGLFILKDFNFNEIKTRISTKTLLDIARYKQQTKIYLTIQKIKNSFHKLVRLVLPYAYATTTVTSTINKTGEDYNTLTLWEDAKDGDLVTLDQIQIAECYDDDGELLDNLNLAGWTTGANNYIQIYAPTAEMRNPSDALRYGVSGFTLDSADSSYPPTNTIIIGSGCQYIRLIGLQIQENLAGGTPTAIRINNTTTYNEAGNTLINQCIIDGNISFSDFAVDSINIRNTLIYCNAGNGCGITDDYASRVDANIYNVTAPEGNIASGDSRSTWTVTNCYAQSYSIIEVLTTSAAEDTTGTPDSLDSLTEANQFVNITAGSEDYHIIASGVLDDAGTDLSGTFTNDIDNETRSGTWDVGADEIVSAAAPIQSQVIWLN